MSSASRRPADCVLRRFATGCHGSWTGACHCWGDSVRMPGYAWRRFSSHRSRSVWPVCCSVGIREIGMASEHEDTRDEQLEALRRHMVRPDSQWEPPTELGFLREPLDPAARSGGRRPSMPWLLVTGLLIVVALVGGVVVGS